MKRKIICERKTTQMRVNGNGFRTDLSSSLVDNDNIDRTLITFEKNHLLLETHTDANRLRFY